MSGAWPWCDQRRNSGLERKSSLGRRWAGFGLVSLHMEGALAGDHSLPPGIGYPWEGQPFQGEQGPELSVLRSQR